MLCAEKVNTQCKIEQASTFALAQSGDAAFPAEREKAALDGQHAGGQ
jgi:hypothetical protein